MIKKLFLLLLIGLLSTSFCFADSHQKPPLGVKVDWSNPMTKGLVGCWILNESGGGTVYDLSGNGNDGTLTNMAFPATASSGWNPGKDGSAIAFDGSNDYVSLPNTTHDFSGVFTVTLWAKWSSLTNRQNLIAKAQDTSNFAFILFKRIDSTNRISLSIKLNGSSTTATDHPTVITAGTWYHIAAVMDSNSDMTLYVNAREPTTTAIGNRNDLGQLRIGETPDLFWNSINGLIDNAQIYNRALTPQEVQELYINPYGMFKKTKVAWWKAGIPVVGGRRRMFTVF